MLNLNYLIVAFNCNEYNQQMKIFRTFTDKVHLHFGLLIKISFALNFEVKKMSVHGLHGICSNQSNFAF